MKIAIIGATGFVGLRLVEEALNRGHEVTAIARNPEKLAITHPRLTVKALDVFEKDVLAKALAGHLAVAVIDEAENRKFLKKRFTVGY